MGLLDVSFWTPLLRLNKMFNLLSRLDFFTITFFNGILVFHYVLKIGRSRRIRKVQRP